MANADRATAIKEGGYPLFDYDFYSLDEIKD